MKIANRKSGFTLMEIMVVIIVIAVLASVAGPMISSITEQGRTSATKSKMASLRSALMTYNGDVGRYPYVGNTANASTKTAYDAAWKLEDNGGDYFGFNQDGDSVMMCATFKCTEMGITNYKKRWKGPYMSSDASDFMYDSWGTRLKYFYYNRGLYLSSAGPQQAHEAVVNTFFNADYSDDDFYLMIVKTKF